MRTGATPIGLSQATRLRMALGAALALSGCSLLGLDRFTQARCTMDRQCSDLAAIAPTGDPCRTWQCNNPRGGDGVCEVRVRDDDDDGSPSAMCVADPMQADCDDNDPTRSRAHAMDQCNLIDDDCDGVPDPTFGATSNTVASLGAEPGRILFSRGLTGSEVTVALIPPRGAAMPPSFGTVPLDGTSMLVLRRMPADPSEGDTGAFATLGGQGVLVVYDPVSSAAACGSDAMRPIQARWVQTDGVTAAVTCLEQTTLASASLTPEPDGDVLLVWVDDASPRECGLAANAAVRARVLRPIGGPMPRIETSEAISIGRTVDALGPSVVFVRDRGWLVAHVTPSGAVEIHRIPVVVSLATLEASVISTLETTSASEVSLAAGSDAEVSVTYTEGGCNEPNRVVLRTANATGGSVTFGDAIVVSSSMSRNRRNPVAAYDPVRREWAVLYRELAEELAARIDRDGMRIGEAVPLGVGTVVGRPYVEAVAPPGSMMAPFWSFLVVTATGEVRSGRFTCQESS